MIRPLSLAKSVAYWALPRGVHDLCAAAYAHGATRMTREERAIVGRNRELCNRQGGRRCFVLATGPSIKSQNLLPLEGEWCFAASDFYKHEHYGRIKPAYYCIAPMHAPFTEEDALRRLREMNQRRHGAETYFFALSDKHLLANGCLDSDPDRVYYLNLRPADVWPEGADITRTLPSPASVSIMAIWIAVYMGFSEICLLGCDHDKLWKWDGSGNLRLDHFYAGAPSIGYERPDIDQALRAQLKVREQYRWSNELARSRGTRIFNASPASYIDIFPKVRLEDVVGQ